LNKAPARDFKEDGFVVWWWCTGMLCN